MTECSGGKTPNETGPGERRKGCKSQGKGEVRINQKQKKKKKTDIQRTWNDSQK